MKLQVIRTCVVAVLILVTSGVTAFAQTATPTPTPPPRHVDNAAWLGHAYVASSSYTAKVAPLAHDFKKNYFVKTWFVNAGSLNSSGAFKDGAAAYSQAVPFLNAVKTAETAEGTTFEVIAWINGTLTSTDTNYIDVSNASIRSNIVSLCQKLTSTTVTGSYIAGANRAFDGIMVDFEPSGPNDPRFTNLKTLMDEIKTGIGSGKKTGFASHKYSTNGSEWSWAESPYYYMGRHVDYIAAMTYGSGLTTTTDYQNWMQSQTYNILRAVSGKTWNNDVDHPAPTNGVKVFIGFPAEPDTAYHFSAVENTRYASLGTEAGLTSLDTLSKSCFQGAAIYLHTDGTGTDGYASKSTDWWWYGRNWLGIW